MIQNEETLRRDKVAKMTMLGMVPYRKGKTKTVKKKGLEVQSIYIVTSRKVKGRKVVSVMCDRQTQSYILRTGTYMCYEKRMNH